MKENEEEEEALNGAEKTLACRSQKELLKTLKKFISAKKNEDMGSCFRLALLARLLFACPPPLSC